MSSITEDNIGGQAAIKTWWDIPTCLFSDSPHPSLVATCDAKNRENHIGGDINSTLNCCKLTSFFKKEKCSVKQSWQCPIHSAIQSFWSYLVIYGVYHHCKTFKQCWNSFRTGPISRGVLLSWVERSNVRLKKFSNEGEASPDQVLHSANCWFSLDHKSQTFKQSNIEHIRLSFHVSTS